MTKFNLEKCKSGNKGITLIALIITIIVLLILAGITIAALTGSDSAPAKANEAKQRNDIGSAKDQLAVVVQNAHLEAYDDIYVKNNSTVSSTAANTTIGQRVINAALEKYGASKNMKFGDASIVVAQTAEGQDATVTITTRDFTETGKISIDGGVLTWDATPAGGGGQQGENEEPEYAGLNQDTLLSNNNMEELTVADINADSTLTSTQKTALTDTTTIKAVLTGNVPVPVGYGYVEGTSTSITKPEGGSYGVVIQDTNENQWVWVPVPDATVLYDTISGTEVGNKEDSSIHLAGVKTWEKVASLDDIPTIKVADTGVNTTKKSKSEIINGDNGTRGYDSESYREPAIVTDYDLQQQYYSQAGNFASAEAFATAMVNDYNAMIESVTKYGGFYVGRYEVGYEAESVTETEGYQTTGSGAYLYGSGTKTGTVRAGVYPLDGVNWYKLYKVCSSLGDSKTTSTMIWGCQHDMVCKWAAESGDKVSYSSEQEHSFEYQVSGSDSNDVRNNVCDLEGSRYEWTQEAYSSNFRACRGGYCNHFDTADNRDYSNPNKDDDCYLGTRATLYIK